MQVRHAQDTPEFDLDMLTSWHMKHNLLDENILCLRFPAALLISIEDGWPLVNDANDMHQLRCLRWQGAPTVTS